MDMAIQVDSLSGIFCGTREIYVGNKRDRRDFSVVNH